MRDHYLILSAGTASLDFSVFDAAASSSAPPEIHGRLDHSRAMQPPPQSAGGFGAGRWPLGPVDDTRAAVDRVVEWLRARGSGFRPQAIGQRVVHGGARCHGAAIVTEQILDELRELVPLAPRDLAENVAAIEAVAAQLPGVPQVACFDTSFHRGHHAVAELVPVPRRLWREGIERYGTHGLTFESVATHLPTIAPEIANRRIVAIALGRDATLCAIKRGKSVDCTSGFTRYETVCSGTSAGALDPSILFYLHKTLRMPLDQLETMLCEESGLLGISGISDDVRELTGRPERSARLAVEYYVYRVVREIGALAAVLGGVDALVFTGAVGEHSPDIRERICRGSAWLGLELDDVANARGGPRISRPGRVTAWVIPANEDALIVRYVESLIGETVADPRS